MDFFSLDKYCTSTSACVSAPGDEFHSVNCTEVSYRVARFKKKQIFDNCVDKVFIILDNFLSIQVATKTRYLNRDNMISDHSITDLTSVGRNSTRCGYGTVEKLSRNIAKYSFSHTL